MKNKYGNLTKIILDYKNRHISLEFDDFYCWECDMDIDFELIKVIK